MNIQSSRKLLFVLTLTLLIIFPDSVFASINRTANGAGLASLKQQTGGPAAVIGTGALNVRNGPGISFNVVTIVYQGQTVSILGRNSTGPWVKIRTTNGLEGWVNSSYISANVAIASLPVLDAPTPIPTAVVDTGALNVRTGPGVSYGIVTAVYYGTTVELIGRNASNTWVLVRLSNGIQGWMNVSSLRVNVLIGSLPLAGSAPPTATGMVATGALNVRSGPGTAYSVVTIVYQGHSVGLLGRNSTGDWVQIRTSANATGWVSAFYLQTNVPIATLSVVAGPPITQLALVATGALNVRSGPGLGYGVVAVIYQGQVVSLLGRNVSGSWLQVRLGNGLTGWCASSLMQTNVAVQGLPVTG